jgi:hypothetical protein
MRSPRKYNEVTRKLGLCLLNFQKSLFSFQTQKHTFQKTFTLRNTFQNIDREERQGRGLWFFHVVKMQNT